MAGGTGLLLPVQDLHKVVVFRILHILLCCPVILLGDVMQVVLKDHLNGFRLDIHQTRLHLTILILHIFQVERCDTALAIDGGHATGLTLNEEAIDTKAQSGGVGEVVGNGSAAAQLITNLFGTTLNRDTQGFQVLLCEHIKNVGFTYITKLGMTVFVVGEVDPGVDNFLIIHKVEDPLTDHGHTIIDAQDSPFYHGGDHHPGDLIKSDLGLIEHLGDDNHGIVTGRSYAKSQVPGFTSHGTNHKPVSTGTGIFIDSGRNTYPLLLGRVVSKRWDPFGQGQVVINGFGYMDILHVHLLLGQEFSQTIGCGSCIITPNGNQQFHIVLLKKINLELIVLRFVTAHLQSRTSPAVDLISIFKIEKFKFSFFSEQTFISAVKSKYIVPVLGKYFSY
jgi:hypothetical protein